ncbi:PAS domain S-box protein [Larkinella soli]|uniref:PAS domain S-box protein n=1 Tax=Larkinella soli TaxID=1770527 RepID=UPI000FFBEC02|nr:PAS domain S-box protein [Larkinella soli]
MHKPFTSIPGSPPALSEDSSPFPVEELALAVFENSPDGIALMTPTRDEQDRIAGFRYLSVNTAFARLLGRSAETIIGRPLAELPAAFVGDGLPDRMIRVLETGRTQKFRYAYGTSQEPGWMDCRLARVGQGVLVNLQDCTEQKKTEAGLLRRLEMESVVATLSGRLINIAAADLDDSLVDALRQVSGCVGADRATVFLFNTDQTTGSCRHEWCADGISSVKKEVQAVALNQFPWWFRMIREGRVISLPTLAEMPPEAEEEKNTLNKRGVCSLLCVPLASEGRILGFLGFYALRKAQAWDEADIALLRTLSAMIVNAEKRRQDEADLIRANRRLQGLRTIDRTLLNSSFSDESPLLAALTHIHELVPCERLIVFRIDREKRLAIAECRLADGQVEARPGIVIPAEYFFQMPLTVGEPILIQELNTGAFGLPPELNLYGRGYRSLKVIPLIGRGQYVGAFVLVARQPGFFTDEYREIAQEVARQLTVVLYQQQLNEQLKNHTEDLERRVEERTLEIRELSALQNAILEHAAQSIISTDVHGIVRTANPATEALLGIPREDLIGRRVRVDTTDAGHPLPVVSYRHESPESPGMQVFQDPLDTWGYYHTEALMVGSENQHIPVLLATSALQDEVGKVTGYMGIATDISALKAAEAALQKKSLELKIFFERALDLHCITSPDGHFVKVNQSWKPTLGYEVQELEGNSFLDLIHPDDRPATVDILRQPVIDGYINRYRHKDGTYRIIQWRAQRYGDLIYASARDITKQQSTEKLLRRANQRLQLATRAARQGTWEYNYVLDRLIWDKRMFEIHGVDPGTSPWTFLHFLELVHPEDRAVLREKETITGENHTFDHILRIIRPDGTVRYTETHGLLVFDSQGRPVRRVGVVWDVTERKQAELALSQSEERYRSLVNHLKEAVFQTDLEGRFQFLNASWTRISGFTVEESLGRPYTDFLHPDDMSKRLFPLLIEGTIPEVRNIKRFRHKDGGHRMLEIFADLTHDDRGNPIGTTGTLTDITERQKAQQALEESEQRFREIAENVDEVFWIHSARPFRLLYINPVYKRILGRSRSGLFTDPLAFLTSVLKEDQAATKAAFQKYREGENVVVQFRIRNAEGRVRWMNMRNFVMKDEKGEPARYIGIATDITSQKEKELVLQQSLEREQELNRLKSQFVSTASHEFRTPLVTIQTSVDLISLYLDRPEATARTAIQRHLSIIGNEIKAFSGLLSDILTIGKIEAGKVATNRRKVNVPDLCREIIAIHFSRRADGRTVRTSVEGEPVPVAMDERLIGHALINLLSNAFKFSKDDPELHLRFTGQELTFRVTDHGIGIPTADLPNLFQTFFRASNTNSIQGTGLGLAISRQFVELHGGTIKVQSEENRGSQFTITLPFTAS